MKCYVALLFPSLTEQYSLFAVSEANSGRHWNHSVHSSFRLVTQSRSGHTSARFRGVLVFFLCCLQLWRELLAAREDFYHKEDLFFSVKFFFVHASCNIHIIWVPVIPHMYFYITKGLFFTPISVLASSSIWSDWT